MSASRSAPRTPPVWQPDDSVPVCPLCDTKFTWYYRKHHCRSCGRVICNACCSNFYSLRSDVIARPPEPESPTLLARLQNLADDDDAAAAPATEEVRTCDACFSRLEQDRCRRMLGLDISSLDPRVAAQLIRESNTSPSLLASPPPSYTQTSVNVERLSTSIPGTERARSRRHEHHETSGSHGHGHRRARRRQSTLDQASSSAPTSRLAPTPSPPREPVVPLRFVAFELNDQDKMLGEECPICFEEYESGQSIARLECWCVFHLRCIKAWKSQKAGTGGCPLHFHD